MANALLDYLTSALERQPKNRLTKDEVRPVYVQPNPAAAPEWLQQAAVDAARGFAQPLMDAGTVLGEALRTRTMPSASDVAQAGTGVAMGIMGPGRLRAPVAAAENAVAKGIRAYHGSPHDFDRFDLSKIGTGEGAQAYGHGLYFAENEKVARQYRDDLTAMRVNSAQRALGQHNDIDAAIAAVRAEISRLRNLPNAGGDAAKRDRFVVLNEEKLAELNALKSTGSMSKGRMYEVNINAHPDDFLDWDKPLTKQPTVATKLGYSPRSSEQIHSEAESLFAKHGPYPNMPSDIKTRIGALQEELDRAAPSLTGADYYRGSTPDDFLHAMLRNGHSMPEMSAALRQKGIPGIRYLDQGSRGQLLLDGAPVPPKDYVAQAAADAVGTYGSFDAAIAALSKHPGYKGTNRDAVALLRSGRLAEAPGTSNYVVFDDSLIDILKKYGLLLPGTGAAVGGNLLMQSQDQM